MTVLQTSPNLGLTLRMQRTTALAPAPSAEGGAVLGASWLVSGILDFGGGFASSQLPDGRWQLSTTSPLGYDPVTSIWEGTPVFVDPDDVVWPVPGPGFRCTEITVGTTYYFDWPGWTFFGVLQTSGSINLQWVLEWNDPSTDDPLVSANGHRVQSYGNVVQVQLERTGTSEFRADTLTATALSGGAPVAVLKLTAVAIAT